jgi:hypothetical protein
MAGFAMTSLMFGPFVLAPLLCALNVAILSLIVERRVRWVTMAIGVICVATPVVMTLAGWGPETWIYEDSAIRIVPHVVAFDPVPTTVFLLLVMLGVVVIPAILIGAERDARAAAERKLALQAFQLVDILPAEAKGQIIHASIGDSMPPSSMAPSSYPPPSEPPPSSTFRS